MKKPFEKEDGTYLEEATEEEGCSEEEYPEEDPENVSEDPWYREVFAPILEAERRQYYGRS